MKLSLLFFGLSVIFYASSQQNTFDGIYDFDGITIPNQEFILEKKIKSVSTKSFSYYIEQKDTLKDIELTKSQLSFVTINYFICWVKNI